MNQLYLVNMKKNPQNIKIRSLNTEWQDRQHNFAKNKVRGFTLPDFKTHSKTKYV